MKLTPKQERFCQEYIKTGNASEAYRLGYDANRMKPETVQRRAKEMLKKGPITARIEELRKAVEDKAIASAKRIQRFWTEVMENTAEETKDRLKGVRTVGQGQGDVRRAPGSERARRWPGDSEDRRQGNRPGGPWLVKPSA